jgi:chaperonin GroEL
MELFSEVIKSGNPSILIISDTMEGQALASLIINKERGVIKPLAIKCPSYGQHREDILQDIAILTSAKFISLQKGMKLEDVKIADLGAVERVKSTISSTILVNGLGTKEDVQARVEEVTGLIENADTEYDKNILKERRAKLSEGVAVIRVGAQTETDLKELKLRVEDAVCATTAAMKGGVLAGGGSALFSARNALTAVKNDSEKRDLNVGERIIYDALAEPTLAIIRNAGESPDILSKMAAGESVDVITGKVGDMLEAGIIDPADVVISALSNAVSAAVMILTTEVLIVDEEKKESK